MIRVPVTQAQIEWAKRRRARFHAECAGFDRFPEVDTDSRWIGDLAEAVLHDVLADHSIVHEWNDPSADAPDISVGPEHRIDVKCRKCAVIPRPSYEVHISEDHAGSTKYDWACFTVYQHRSQVMWICGVLCREMLLHLSKRRRRGVGSSQNRYTAKCDNRHLLIDDLVDPFDWLAYIGCDAKSI